MRVVHRTMGGIPSTFGSRSAEVMLLLNSRRGGL